MSLHQQYLITICLLKVSQILRIRIKWLILKVRKLLSPWVRLLGQLMILLLRINCLISKGQRAMLMRSIVLGRISYRPMVIEIIRWHRRLFFLVTRINYNSIDSLHSICLPVTISQKVHFSNHLKLATQIKIKMEYQNQINQQNKKDRESWCK